ncbi:MAG: HAD family hydrolase [candidate division Zixibacteria bacterium]|nr:HAD family hydrolase [candidate division Zixibacteria bacterium]NIR67065.1 HAD family hydrolase [candidate division Zixibacteria bacterium]NIS18089.1 HAD family hydrolase [candidate division Zixibacteria bacterium]NIS48476.1 HAD family hydrolase [candidate division Zixibacteria bacterium]NIT54374.1 HAD family hydrolase [candidate division Zixibacteria bacterium]
MTPLKEKDAAIFDLGSTLIEYENIPWPDLFKLSLQRAHKYLHEVDIEPPEFDKFHEVFLEKVIEVEKESNVTHKEKDILKLFESFLSYFGISNNSDFLEKFLEVYYQPVRESIYLKEGAMDVLDYYKSNGHKIGLISNTVFPPEYHLEDMRKFGIDKFFDHLIFSSAFPRRKPHPSIYTEMLRVLDISASKAFFIGDRVEIDVLGAKNCGVFSILLRKKGREYSDLSLPDLVIDNLSELLKYY